MLNWFKAGLQYLAATPEGIDSKKIAELETMWKLA